MPNYILDYEWLGAQLRGPDKGASALRGLMADLIANCGAAEIKQAMAEALQDAISAAEDAGADASELRAAPDIQWLQSNSAHGGALMGELIAAFSMAQMLQWLSDAAASIEAQSMPKS